MKYSNNFTYLIKFSPTTSEYKLAMKKIDIAVENHKRNLLVGKPVLDLCDASVMVNVLFGFFNLIIVISELAFKTNKIKQNWAPNGCEKLKKCLPVPDPQVTKCIWPH